MFRYENMATEVIKVDLQNDFNVIGMASWNKNENYYISSTENDKMNVIINFDKNRYDF